MSGAADRGALETVVVTGLSGAGRSTAAKCLEDLGYFVVDNLPPELISTMVELGSRTQGAITRIAVDEELAELRETGPVVLGQLTNVGGIHVAQCHIVLNAVLPHRQHR